MRFGMWALAEADLPQYPDISIYFMLKVSARTR
jgi:hypothetical protein